jgi:Ubiquitin family
MQIFVHTLHGQVVPLECESIDTIAHIKARLRVIKGLPPHERQRLIFSGKQLEENRTLAEYGIQETSLIHDVLPLIGGGAGEYVILVF